MADRYTRKDAEAAFERLCKALDKPMGHYAPCAVGESNLGPTHMFRVNPGAWALDHNGYYGGYVIDEVLESTGVRQPFGSSRHSAREFCDMVRFAIDAIDLAKKREAATIKLGALCGAIWRHDG